MQWLLAGRDATAQCPVAVEQHAVAPLDTAPANVNTYRDDNTGSYYCREALHDSFLVISQDCFDRFAPVVWGIRI